MLKIKTDVSVLNINKPELIESQKIKLETEESCNPADYLKAEYSDEDEFYKPSSSTVENNYNNHDPCTKIKGSIINYKKYGDKKNLKTMWENMCYDKINPYSLFLWKYLYFIFRFDCPRCHALFINDNVFKKHIQEFHSDTGNDESFNKVRVPLG